MSEYLHHLDYGKYKFIYAGVRSWNEVSLRKYENLREAVYPPTEVIKANYLLVDEFPEFDFLVVDPRYPKLLFTGEHVRLLHEDKVLAPSRGSGSSRVVINVDYHSDFDLGMDIPEEIHSGNWGVVGVALGNWSHFVHVSGNYGYLGHVDYSNVPVKKWDIETSYYQISLNRINIFKLLRILQAERFILSIDADEFRGKNDRKLFQLYQLIRQSVETQALDYIHFTPSPAHCDKELAVKVWDFIRAALLAS